VIALIEQIVDWIGPAFAVAGYYIVFAGVFADRSAFLGLVIPGDVVLALGGVFAARGELSLPIVIAVGAVAGLMGESTGFYLGNRYGERILKKVPILKRWAGDLQKAEDYFDRHGGKTVFIGRYVSLAGTFLPFAAGMSKMRYRRFLLFDIPSVIIWAVGISLLGYFLASQIDLIDTILSRFGWGLLALVVLFFGGRFVYKKWIKKDSKKSSGSKSSSSGSSKSSSSSSPRSKSRSSS
jgi:membrane protein DedA with SNARE-associated domain